MTTVKILDGQLDLTFRKRSMRSLLIQNRILEDLQNTDSDVIDTTDDVEQVFVVNFSAFMARTESIELADGIGNVDNPIHPMAVDLLTYWNHAQGTRDYVALYIEYSNGFPIEVNNLWYDALKQADYDPARLDPDLNDAKSLPDSVLQDETVQKKDN